MKASPQAYEIIKFFESLELESYPDPYSKLGLVLQTTRKVNKNKKLRFTDIKDWQNIDGSPWTIGYGHTASFRDGRFPNKDTKISKEFAEELLKEDVGIVEAQINSWAKNNNVKLNQNQFDALTSFIYNIGFTKFKGKTIESLLIKGDMAGAADQFKVWRLANGIISNGLVKRRAKEEALFRKV